MIKEQHCPNTRLAYLCLLALGTLLLSSGLGAETFEIKLERPSKVGDKYNLAAVGSKNDHMTMSAAGRTNSQKNSMIVDLRGAVEVLAVDAKGHETKIACAVERCFVRRAGVQSPLFPNAKTVVLERRDGRKSFSVDGKAVTREESEALDVVLEVHSTEHGDDDVFGTKEKKRIGDSWPINSAVAAKDLQQMQVQIAPEDLKGSVKLEDKTNFGGKECLKISASMKAIKLGLKENPGLQIRQANIECDFAGFFPTDKRVRCPKETVSFRMALKGEVPSGDGVAAIEINSEQSVERTIND